MKKRNTTHLSQLVLAAICSFGMLPSIHAQAPAIEWSVCLGGMGLEGPSTDFNTANDVYGLQVLQTSDGGFITVGNTNQNSGYVEGVHSQSTDVWIVKTDANGQFQWQRTYGSQGYDTATSVALTPDGGYIVAGTAGVNGGDVEGNHGGTDMWVLRLSSTGDLVWKKCYGGTGTEKAYSIQATTDQGFIIAGVASTANGDVTGHHGSWNTSDAWVVKIDGAGVLQWQKNLGGTNEDVAYSIRQTSDGGYIVGGMTLSNDGDVSGNHTYWNSSSASTVTSKDFWLVKLDAAGSVQWQKCLGGTGEDTGYSVTQAQDGGYVIVGRSNSTNGDVSGNRGLRDFWIAKVNASGTLQWQKSLGGSNNDRANFVETTTDGGFIIVGDSSSQDQDVTGLHGSNSDYWVVRLDADGNLVWQKTLGGTSPDSAYSVVQTQDGGFAIAGTTLSRDGDVTGLHYNSNATDFWLVKLAPEVMSTTEFGESMVRVFPNPVQSVLHLSETVTQITVTDLTGKVLSVANHTNQISTEMLSAGTYLVKIQMPSGTIQTQKILKR